MAISKAKAEIEALAAAGLKIELVNVGAQPYAHVRHVEAPSPPWDRASYDIFIAIPLAYDDGSGLDAFYLEQPYQYNGAKHGNVVGQDITCNGKTWKQVSWHYADTKPFDPKVDNIESHIVHCRGFFLHRGATNARS